MYTKSEFCKKAGISQETLRHYVDIGLLNPKEVTEKGYRKYSEDSILDLWFYRLGASLGNPLKEMKNWKHSMTLQNFYEGLKNRECALEKEIRELEIQKSMIREILYYTEHELRTNQAVSEEAGLEGYRAFCDGGPDAEQKISRFAEAFPLVSIEIDYRVPGLEISLDQPLESRLGICIMEEQWKKLGMTDRKGLEKMPAMDSLCMSLVTASPLVLTKRTFLPLLQAAQDKNYEICSDIICSMFCREMIGNQAHYLLKCRILVKKGCKNI
ncbi:MAG: MerR family transcriptional regulator [Lachnospiraceae bacterium]